MKTLGEAWDWYDKNRRLLQLMSRLGRRYWNDLPWEVMGNDDHFRSLGGVEVEKDANAVLEEFDDIAVFVFFSVFESTVRSHVWGELTSEVASLSHPALKKMAEKTKDNIEEGSFYNNILDLYKNTDHDLVEAVNQVRKYRNWVAHGRRKDRKGPNTTPRDAFDRLHAFLTHIGHSPEPA